jgi:hypothetical protein
VGGSFPSLGFDPAPGDLATAEQVTRGVADTAVALEEISTLLSGAAAGAWRGQASIAFRDLLDDEFRPRVTTAARSFDTARQALDGWLDTMRSSQSRARSLEAQHAEAVHRARAAHVALASIPEATPPAGATRTPEEASVETERLRARATVSRSVASADAEVERIERDARKLLDEYEDLGRAAAARMQRAIDIAPTEPGFWQRLAGDMRAAIDVIDDFLDDAGDWAIGFLEELAPMLDLFADLAGLLGAVGSLLVWIPGLNCLGGALLVVGALGTAARYAAAVGETGSFAEALTDGDFLMDAAGLALGAGGWRVGTKLVDAARSGGSFASGAPAVRMVRQWFGPDIPMAPSFLELAVGESYSMGTAELGWRLVDLKLSQAEYVLGVIEAPGHVATVNRLVSGTPAVRARRPQAVA